ncbi:MAG: UDP-N-acetylmuramoyl-L-alanine--D-glutamate ligase [Syntrophorhabdaceae bacterium]|nr:UDP-N-acetylmuramoyl-L-alanine--D-glutamate ligase [Syntrophorhabdaceae bacterium]
MGIPEHILIVGLGATGIAVAKFLNSLGKKIAITDEKKEEELKHALKELEGIGFQGMFGGHREEDFLKYPMIILSPGVDSNLHVIGEARRRGIKVVGEIELASWFVEEPIIAITGTNGKTTVTSLIGEIFKEAYGDVFVGGNIGNPLINYVMEKVKRPYIILEISSFQLETIEHFRPDTAVLLNITEDHLDRYRSFSEYEEAKYRIFENQRDDNWAVINEDIPRKRDLKGHTLFFSMKNTLKEGAFYSDGLIHVRLKGKETVYRRDLSPLIGVHNTENIMAALIVSHIYDIQKEVIEEVLNRFKGLPHRVEPVREVGGIRFYNDSKATNVDATRRALQSIEGNVVLIAGGKDKMGTYKVLSDVMGKVKAMVLIGEAKERILKEIGGLTKTYTEETLESAVNTAFRCAEKGDIVLFSPMCSSFDMFRDYKERGNRFKEIVEGL